MPNKLLKIALLVFFLLLTSARSEAYCDVHISADQMAANMRAACALIPNSQITIFAPVDELFSLQMGAWCYVLNPNYNGSNGKYTYFNAYGSDLLDYYPPDTVASCLAGSHATPTPVPTPASTPVPTPPPAPTPAPQPTPVPQNQSCSVVGNSSVDVDSLTLTEQISLVGIPFSLNYESDRVVGRKDDFKIHIPLLTNNIVNVQSVSLKVVTAGQELDLTFSPLANLAYDYVWNGKDTSGNIVEGSAVATITITVTMSDGRSYPTTYTTPIGHFEAASIGLGGWTVSPHHFYDVAKKILYFGSGGSRPVTAGQFRGSLLIPALDSSEAYLFDQTGRHQATVQGLTGATLYSFTYDANGQLASVSDGFGNRTVISRLGATTTLTSPYGDLTKLTLDTSGWISNVVNPNSETFVVTSSTDGLLLRYRKPNGITSAVNYDSRGRVMKDTGAGGDFLQFLQAIGNSGTTTTSQTAMNRTTSYQTTPANGGLIRIVTDPSGLETTSYSSTLGLSEFSPPSGLFTYATRVPDARFGSQATFTSATGAENSNLSTETTSAQSANLADVNDPFSVSSLIVSSVVDSKKTYVSTYDGNSKSISKTSPEGRSSVATYTPSGQLKSLKVALYDQTNLTYDSRGRLTSVQQGSRTSSIAYDDRGRVSQTTDPQGNKTRYAYDLAGRLLTQTRPDGQSIAYTYDANGNITSIRPPQRLSHAFDLNLFELPSKCTPPALASNSPISTQYSYNLDKQLTRIDRPDGKSIAINYGATSGVLNSVVTPDIRIDSSYNSNGQLQNLTSNNGTVVSRTYDAALVASETVSGPITTTVTYGYNNDFSLASIALSGSSSVSYATDKDGLLTQAGDVVISRDRASGDVSGTTLGAVSEVTAYNSTGEMTLDKCWAGREQLFSEWLTRDSNGRIIERSETQKALRNIVKSYKYDTLGRLIEVRRSNGRATKYSYDANGNRIAVDRDRDRSSERSERKSRDDRREKFSDDGKDNRDRDDDHDGKIIATYDSQDRLVRYGETNYAYNANGELIGKYHDKKQIASYAYDSLGRLTSVGLKDGKRIDYVLDALGRRIARKVNGKIDNYYVYQSPLQLAGVLDSHGKIVERFVYGTKSNVPDEVITSKGKYRIISDHLGSPRMVVNSANGHIVAKMDYDEFGIELVNSKPGLLPFGFAGGLYDRDTKLVHFGAREYDASIGRWFSKDPILFNGGDTNLYGYVFNDPINSADSRGLWGVSVGAGIVGIIGGGYSAGAGIYFGTNDGHFDFGLYGSGSVGLGYNLGAGLNGSFTPGNVSDLSGETYDVTGGLGPATYGRSYDSNTCKFVSHNVGFGYGNPIALTGTVTNTGQISIPSLINSLVGVIH